MRKTQTDLTQDVLELLANEPDGLTWKELQLALRDKFESRAHHGSISGCLSKLHKQLEVFTVMVKRENCRPYVHSKFRSKYSDDMRRDYPTSQNKWKGMADLLYFVMTADKVPADAWDNALETYRKMNNV